jgi:hypothetical protein
MASILACTGNEHDTNINKKRHIVSSSGSHGNNINNTSNKWQHEIIVDILHMIWLHLTVNEQLQTITKVCHRWNHLNKSGCGFGERKRNNYHNSHDDGDISSSFDAHLGSQPLNLRKWDR